MNAYIILLLVVAGIVAYFWCVFYSKKKEAEQKLERYIQEKAKIRETIKEEKTRRQSEVGKTQVVPSTKESEYKSGTTIASVDDDSIEIRADGTWICPNDETINDGDVCIICGQSRLGATCKKDELTGVIEIDHASIATEKAPEPILKKGFSVAYPAKLSTLDTSKKAKEKIPENVYSTNMDNTLLTYDDG